MTDTPILFKENLAAVEPGVRRRLEISAQTSDAAAIARAALEMKAKGMRVLVVCAER